MESYTARQGPKISPLQIKGLIKNACWNHWYIGKEKADKKAEGIILKGNNFMLRIILYKRKACTSFHIGQRFYVHFLITVNLIMLWYNNMLLCIPKLVSLTTTHYTFVWGKNNTFAFVATNIYIYIYYLFQRNFLWKHMRCTLINGQCIYIANER